LGCFAKYPLSFLKGLMEGWVYMRYFERLKQRGKWQALSCRLRWIALEHMKESILDRRRMIALLDVKGYEIEYEEAKIACSYHQEQAVEYFARAQEAYKKGNEYYTPSKLNS
jgi:hypothetical protein